MKSIFGVLICVLALSKSWGQVLPDLRVVTEWTRMEFDFPSDAVREEALETGAYVPGIGLPIDVDVDFSRQKPRVFVTFPRSRPGIPVTVGTISSYRPGSAPVIRPYPDYWWQSSQGWNCSQITSVYRVAVSK